MARPRDPKTERIHVRLSPEEHSLAKRQASAVKNTSPHNYYIDLHTKFEAY